MKRWIFVMGICVGLLASTQAAAAGGPTGTVEKAKRGTDFALSFTVVVKNGEPTKIKRFKWQNLPLTCDEGNPLMTLNGHLPAMAVNRQGKFRGDFDGTGGDDPTAPGTVNYKPRGAFVSKRKLKGTLNVSGDFNNAGAEQDYNNCTSGPFPWVARLG